MSTAIIFIVGGLISIGAGFLIYKDIQKQKEEAGQLEDK